MHEVMDLLFMSLSIVFLGSLIMWYPGSIVSIFTGTLMVEFDGNQEYMI